MAASAPVSGKVRAARWAGALLMALAPIPWLGLGASQANAGASYAEVTGYEPFSAAANSPGYWGDTCSKAFYAGGVDSYQLTQDYALVVVKAGASNVDPFTNTLFADASKGQLVWADSNGNGAFDPGGKDGDKQISHVIACTPDQSHSASPSRSVSTSGKPSHSTSTSGKPSTSISTSASSSPSTSISTSASSSPSTSISTSASSSPSTSISTSASSSPSTSISTSRTSSPSTSISTQHSGEPSTSSSHPASAGSSTPVLPQTGSGTPVAGAMGISLMLIGVGLLLLLGPGRLMPAPYQRKH